MKENKDVYQPIASGVQKTPATDLQHKDHEGL